MVFLMDVEKVSNNGFVGIETLSEKDKIILFFSEKNSITITTHCNLEKSKATKEYVLIKLEEKNALDFQLSTYLGYLIAQDKEAEYCIVSSNEGFNYVVNFWINRNVRIVKSLNLKKENKENNESKQNNENNQNKQSNENNQNKQSNEQNPNNEKQENKATLKDEIVSLLPQFKTEVETIITIMKKNKTKQSINNALVKEFGSGKTGLIYKKIRPLL